MVWIFFPFVAAFFYSLSDFTINYTVDMWCKRIRPQCLKIVNMVLHLVGCAVIIVLQREALVDGASGWVILMLLCAGVINSVGAIPYYLALKKDDTTEITLLSQMMPVLALIFGVIFLKQVPTMGQGVAFVLIMAAMLLLVFKAGRKVIRFKFTTCALMMVACIFWVLSDVLFISQAGGIDFLTGFFWLLAGDVLGNFIMTLVMKSWRQDAKTLFKRNKAKKIFTMVAGEGFWWVAEMMWRMGMLMAPIAIMTVTESVIQLILTFILGIVLTLLWPKFGREKLSKRVVMRHAVATVLVTVGVVLIS